MVWNGMKWVEPYRNIMKYRLCCRFCVLSSCVPPSDIHISHHFSTHLQSISFSSSCSTFSQTDGFMRLPVAMGFLISFQPMRRTWESIEHYQNQNYCFFLFWGESLARVLGTALQDINCWAEQTAFWTRESLVAEVLPPQRLGRTWASTKTLRPVATWWVLEASKVNMKLASWVGGELDEEKFHARGGEIRCLFFLGIKDFQALRFFLSPDWSGWDPECMILYDCMCSHF